MNDGDHFAVFEFGNLNNEVVVFFGWVLHHQDTMTLEP